MSFWFSTRFPARLSWAARLLVHSVSLAILIGFVPAFAAQDRIAGPIDHTRSVPLKRQAGRRALTASDLGPVDAAMPIDHATLLFKPAPSLPAFLAALQLPGTPEYHRWLTPDQFGERFGLSAADLKKVTAWLASQGFQVEDVARGRHWVTFSGTAAQVGQAFGTELHHYLERGKMHFANATDLAIPAALDSVVSGVIGLDDFGLVPQLASDQVVPMYNTSTAHYLAPEDLSLIYNINPLYQQGIDGTGQTIVIVGQSAIDLADGRTFRKTYGLAAADPQVVLIGKDPGTNSALVEANLDLQWAGAVAKNAKIVYVYASNVFTAAQSAVDQNLGSVLSMSFGGCEVFNNPGYQAVVQQANAQGMTWLVASGDGGAATCDWQYAVTPQATLGISGSFPSTIPEVTSVGGTQFAEGSGKYWATSNSANGGSVLSYIPEVAWNEAAGRNALIAGGGGPSHFYTKPFWQTGKGVPDDGARDTPDIAFTASTHDAYLVYSGGTLHAVGGTSASSPMFAGVVALLNQSLVNRKILLQPGLGNINPALYRLAQATTDVFKDTVTGDNKLPCAQGSSGCVNGYLGYNALPGYDMATGLGSADVFRLVTEWSTGTQSTTTLAISPEQAGLGETVQLTASVSGSGAPPTGRISFLVVNGTDGIVATADLVENGTSSQATATVEAAKILGGDGTVTALYNGDGVYGGSAGLAKIAVKAVSAGSLVVPFITPNPVTASWPGPVWQYKVVLSEKAGAATTLTSFTVDGVVQGLSSFSSTAIAANGSVNTTTLTGSGLAVPLNRVFRFSGKDADGTVWTQSVTVPFIAGSAPPLQPGITLSSAVTSVQATAGAPAACAWTHPVILQETGGFLVTLSTFRAGTADLSASIQQLFGTTRLAPHGMLQANVCIPAGTVTGTFPYTITGSSELGGQVSASLSVTLAPPAATPAQFTTTSVFDSAAGKQTVSLNFSTGTPAWTATVYPASASWVTLSTASGRGAGAVTIQSSAAGLSNGVYTAIVALQAPDCLPQVVNIPVTFVVGSSNAITINGVANAASYGSAAAPGMYLYVAGDNLAPTTQLAALLPLPLSLAGVSATVNGITAPLYYVLPKQIVVQIPYEAGAGPAVLAVNNNGLVAFYRFQISVTAPGIFTAPDLSVAPNSSGKPGDTLLAFITGDGDLTPTLATGAAPASTTALSRLPKSRQPLTLTVGGVAATVSFYGVPSGLAGVTQINFVVPATVPAGVQDVVVTVGGVASAAAKLTVLGQ